ncbi:MAG TPA: Glu/Leu/Phe/Val dehydrogenase dimerization domain-containing protein [Planctomycetota bacterium]|nr:Glu/Leu/Phe/Val dehydrogenase dimerization domain-containing protein [Planctomycetota bacterium]
MEISEIQVDGYEKVARCRDAASGLHALIAVHDTTLGPALGGMRMLPYVSEDEALFDVLRLAKGMTYKSAVAETGLGGGKSVVIGDPSTKSEALFRAMGRFVDSFGGRYITAEDMNIGIPDLEIVRQETRWVTGLRREAGSSGNPSPYTALGCIHGMRAVLEEAFGDQEFAGKHFLLQGVGAVGGRIAELLKERGARVTICDINTARVESLCREHGFDAVDDATHLEVECDVYAPCARGATLNDTTIPRLRCKAVAGCANNQLLEPKHAEDLRDRGILYAPDYVINAGGIINVGVELFPGGYDEAVALERIDRIYDNLKRVFQISRTEGINTRESAARLAEERLAAGRTAKVR